MVDSVTALVPGAVFAVADAMAANRPRSWIAPGLWERTADALRRLSRGTGTGWLPSLDRRGLAAG